MRKKELNNFIKLKCYILMYPRKFLVSCSPLAKQTAIFFSDIYIKSQFPKHCPYNIYYIDDSALMPVSGFER
jgi:hypothetical protein